MYEEDDSSAINARLSDPRAANVVGSGSGSNAIGSAASSASTPTMTKTGQNAAILQASLDVSLQSKNQPLALLLKSAITAINALLKPTLGDDAIQAAVGEDNTPAGTAGRIVALSTAFFDAFAQQHPGDSADDVLTKFMATLRSGFEKGAQEAQAILKDMGVLDGDIAANIDKTLELVRQGYADFEAARRGPQSGTTPPSARTDQP